MKRKPEKTEDDMSQGPQGDINKDTGKVPAWMKQAIEEQEHPQDQVYGFSLSGEVDAPKDGKVAVVKYEVNGVPMVAEVRYTSSTAYNVYTERDQDKPSLIKCVNCGILILETETVCPWCGEDPRSPADNSTETTEDAMQTYTFKVKTDLPDEIKVQADCENDAIDEAEHKLAMLFADSYEPPVDIEGPVETMETTEGEE